MFWCSRINSTQQQVGSNLKKKFQPHMDFSVAIFEHDLNLQIWLKCFE